jgi:hypothetical protein
MLKITSLIRAGHRTLVLEGKLTDPWLAELERTWIEARRLNSSATVAIELKDVTAISEKGELLLRQMSAEGAKFTCCRGIFTKHVVKQLVAYCTGKKKEEPKA